MTEREKQIQRIRAFLARAADSASTADEALIAARRAAKLMDTHGISGAEVDDINAMGGMSRVEILVDTVWQQPAYTNIAVRIGQYAGCYPFVQRRNGRNVKRDIKINFYGEAADVLFAEWLLKSVASFVITGCNDETQGAKWERSDLADYRHGYLVSAAQRINARLKELLEERNTDRVASNLPALVDKGAAAEHAFKATGTEIVPATETGKIRYVPTEAVDKGRARGDAASFAQGVEAQTPTAQIH